MNKFHIDVLTTILIALLFTACGGGGGGSDSPAAIESSNSAPQGDSQPDSDADQGVPVVSTGVITGFGSIFVNGVEYETDGANVSTDDNANASEDDLEVGMVVMVTGTINADGVTGDASDIEYHEELQGVVEDVNLTEEFFTVLGQLIRVDELTNFEGVTFESLQAGHFVEVSGLVDAEGTILASLVKLEDRGDASDNELKLEGRIRNLDTEISRFELHGLIIDYSIAEFKNGTHEELGEDVYVRVKSHRDFVDGILLADKIVIKKQAEDGAAGDPIVIDGIIDSFESPENFTVNGHRSLVNDATRFLNGSSIDDLVLNQRLRIKGTLNDTGIIVIEHLTLRARHYLSMEGEIEAINEIDGTLTMLGITFLVNEDTHFIDSGDDRIRYFSLSDLLVEDRIEIKAVETPDDTQYLAIKIKRHHDHDSDEIKLSGHATEIDPEQARFSLNGFLILVVEETEIGIHHGNDLDASAFFELLTEGSTVKIEGYAESGMVIASEVRLRKATDKDEETSDKRHEHGDSSGEDEDDDDEDNGEHSDEEEDTRDDGEHHDEEVDTPDENKSKHGDEEEDDAGSEESDDDSVEDSEQDAAEESSDEETGDDVG